MFDFGLANEEQKQAIQTVDGPVLIIAGPGDCVIIMMSPGDRDKSGLLAGRSYHNSLRDVCC